MEPLHLRVNGEDFESTPLNTSLFTFAGELAMYDHVFLITGEEESPQRLLGAYVFKTLQEEAYKTLHVHIKKNKYPQHLNMLIAPQCDRDAFDNIAFNDLSGMDGVPEGWTDK